MNYEANCMDYKSRINEVKGDLQSNLRIDAVLIQL